MKITVIARDNMHEPTHIRIEGNWFEGGGRWMSEAQGYKAILCGVILGALITFLIFRLGP